MFENMVVKATRPLVLFLVIVAVAFVFSCGRSGGTGINGVIGTMTDGMTENPDVILLNEDAVVTIGDRAELRAYTRPSSVFSVDDFIEAGWKKNKEYPLDTLPEATGVYFGFYNRKDIEIRVYPSHDVAMAAGRESAETAIKTEKLSGRGAGFSSVTLYGAYVVAGNTVMLCEISVTDCTDLLDQIAQ